jgi:hypothetical protein
MVAMSEYFLHTQSRQGATCASTAIPITRGKPGRAGQLQTGHECLTIIDDGAMPVQSPTLCLR